MTNAEKTMIVLCFFILPAITGFLVGWFVV